MANGWPSSVLDPFAEYLISPCWFSRESIPTGLVFFFQREENPNGGLDVAHGWPGPKVMSSNPFGYDEPWLVPQAAERSFDNLAGQAPENPPRSPQKFLEESNLPQKEAPPVFVLRFFWGPLSVGSPRLSRFSG